MEKDWSGGGNLGDAGRGVEKDKADLGTQDPVQSRSVSSSACGRLVTLAIRRGVSLNLSRDGEIIALLGF